MSADARCALAAGVLALAACGHGSPQDSAAAPEQDDSAGSALLMGLPVIDPNVQVLQASSHAPNGSNTTDFAHAIRTDDQGRFVLMEASGPGAITRIWFTPLSTTGEQGDPAAIGQIRIFFDGEATPRVDLPAAAFFSGKTTPFLAPLCGNDRVSSGGNYCNLRMPFRRSVKFTASVRTNYYDIGYETFPDDTPVQTFDPGAAGTQAAAREMAALYARAGSRLDLLPAGPETRDGGTIAAGGRAVLADIARAGTLEAIEVELDPHDDASLRNVWLEARWDGEATPSVDAPLAELFLTGAGERTPASGLLAGYSPQKHVGYLYFPMPFARSAQVALVNHGSVDVAAAWRVHESTQVYEGVGTTAGRFHATYAEDPATALGSDYVLLDATGAGKVVGLSFTEAGPLSSDVAFFMEGDERVHIDGSRTPQLYGTGTEDLFSGAYYYATGPFTLPDHGATARESVALANGLLGTGGLTAQYRLMIGDPWTFRDGLRFGIEHASGNGLSTAARSVVFWYAVDRPRLALTDEIVVGDASSEQAAGYVASDGESASLTAFFEGDRDGNLSSVVQDLANLGSLPPLPGTDPRGEAVSAIGRRHSAGATIRFAVNVDHDNQGVILRRQLDQGTFGQRAAVLVDGLAAGTWFVPGANDSKRWAESDFAVPQRLTAGKARLAVELRILPAEEPPAAAETGWNDFGYRAYSIRPP